MHSFLCKIVVHDSFFLKLSNLFLDFYIIFIRLDTGQGNNLVLAFCWPRYQNCVGCASNPPQDVVHIQFQARISFELVWCPTPQYGMFFLVDDTGSPGYPYHCSRSNKRIITSLQEVNMPPSQIRLQPQCWKQPPPCTRKRPPPPNAQNYITHTLLPSLFALTLTI